MEQFDSLRTRATCVIEECDRPAQAKGCCGNHYQAVLRYLGYQSQPTGQGPRRVVRTRPAQNAKRYGLTNEQYEALVAAGCAWCGEPIGVKVHIDHDHDTGAVRGATHPVCNMNWIGGHTVESAQRLVVYLSGTHHV